jgi:5'-3' exonuclease
LKADIKLLQDKITELYVNQANTVLIIDGLNTFIRSFAVVDYVNINGYYVGGLLGFLQSMAYAIRLINPAKVIIVFDGQNGSQRRRKLYPDYKSKRKPSYKASRYSFASDEEKKESMRQQLRRLLQYFDVLPVKVIMVDNIEADDTIAYLSKTILKDKYICIMSTDTDFLQLVDNRITVWSPTKKKIYDEKSFKEEYNISSLNFIYYKALLGDNSDNIRGLSGFGKKTIVNRLPMLCEDVRVNLEDIYQYAIDQQLHYKVYKCLLDNKETFELNIKLMQLEAVDISGLAKIAIMDIIDADNTKINKPKLIKYLIEDGLTDRIKDPIDWINRHFNKLEFNR